VEADPLLPHARVGRTGIGVVAFVVAQAFPRGRSIRVDVRWAIDGGYVTAAVRLADQSVVGMAPACLEQQGGEDDGAGASYSHRPILAK
jgi:hypothetical protein